MAKVLLLDSPSWRLFDPKMHLHLGILYLAGSLRQAGHNVKVLDCHKVTSWDGSNLILHTELMEECDVLGVSATTANVHWGGQMASVWPAKYKVLGGSHVTHIMEGRHEVFKQKKYFPGFDYLMFGECEEAFVTFCDRVDTGKGFYNVPGLVDFNNPLSLHVPVPVQPDVTKLAMPAFDLWEAGFKAGALSSPSVHRKEIDGSQLLTASLYTARGCPYGCKFCADARTKIREESLEQIEAQVKLLSAMGVQAIRIQDDTYSIKDKRAKDIADILHKYRMKWRGTTRVNLVNSQLFDYLYTHGCTELGFGIEHGSEDMLKKMDKGTTPAKNAVGVKLCQAAGIIARAFLMIGFPGETEKSITELEEWVLSVRPDSVTLSIFQPFPGSDVWNYPERYGVTIPQNSFDKFWNLGSNDDPSMLILDLPTMSKDRLYFHRKRLTALFEKEIGYLDRTRLHGNIGTFSSNSHISL